MTVLEIIKLIGIICWLLHRKHHSKLCDLSAEPTEEFPEGRDYEVWSCRKCNNRWEVPS